MFLYRFFLAIDILTALIVAYFFFVGLGDGSVSSFNMGMWIALIGGVSAIIAGGIALNGSGHRKLACAVLAILALPALGFALFMAMLIITNPRWN